MNETSLTRLMYTLIIVGLGVAAIGVGLVIFTDIVTGHGVQGIALVAGLIAGGLFLSIPAKIYLTFQLMKRNDEKIKAMRERGEIR
jgi:hypothetical protein